MTRPVFAQVCDHAKWASALGLKRIIHKIEANEQQGTECALHRPCISPFSYSACGIAALFSLALAVSESRDVVAA